MSTFDEAAGLGQVATPDGATHPFHCTSIADGSRTIGVGTPVTFVVTPGRSGAWEAVQVSPRR